MDNDFYKRWFSTRTIIPPSEKELWERHTEYLINLSQSEHAEKLKQRFDIPAIKEAEKQFSAILKEIPDPDIKFKIDAVVGELARAYETLGFCAGHFSTDSRSYKY